MNNERLSFPLAQIPLGLTATGADGWAPVLRAPGFSIGMALPMALGMLHGLHRYSPSIPDLPVHPMLEFDFAARGTPPWSGMGTLEFHLSPWLVGIVALLPAEISFSGWLFFWITKLEDVSALVLGATDLPSVYSNHYPALYAQGAGAAYALAALALWGSRRQLGRPIRAAWKGELPLPILLVLLLVIVLGLWSPSSTITSRSTSKKGTEHRTPDTGHRTPSSPRRALRCWDCCWA